MGYGYGVWLRINNSYIKSIVKHPAHVTIMCNMSKKDATTLYNELKIKYGSIYKIYTDGKCYHFNDSYGDKDLLKACGYYCEVQNLKKINKTCLNYKGVIPDNPHISTDYNFKKDDLLLLDSPNIIDNSLLALVDINSDEPMAWKILCS